ncbi:helix-turn-helix domain-containing protein [Flavobacterium sp. SM15]|uniref:helix-turn-helix domain-containing protein n=1 Tax=Flavobacterium sp. SM15 TaxID=2908005 RepID=UPI001EDA3E94|nr:helix-turn-helix domain-containing protein [Flavobacterium sp. SM15]MCG2611731.1 helix-turn-helix domain-containing protein [Flavobacterium sp. SM15]
MNYKIIQFYFFILTIFSLTLCSNPVFAQVESKRDILFNESEGLMLSKPNEAMKVGLHLLKNSSTDQDKAKINFLIAKIYAVKGDYNNALNYLFEAEKTEIDSNLSFEISIMKSKVLRILFLDKQAKMSLEEAEKHVSKKDEKKAAYGYARIVIEKASMSLDRQDYKTALEVFEKADPKFQSALKDNKELTLLASTTKGKIYTGLGNLKEAQSYFDQADVILKKSKIKNDLGKIHVLLGLSNVYFYKKEHAKAIETLLEAETISQPLENLYLTESINKQLSINYIALNDRLNYKKYNSLYLKNHSQIDNQEQESVNTAYNLFAQQFETNFQKARQASLNKFYLVLTLAFLIALGVVFFWLKYVLKRKRLNEIINYLEVTRSNSIIKQIEKKEEKETKKIFIPQETEQILLNKLKRFENSTRFTNNDISLAVLAGQFETNTKYLSEIINKHYNINFNTYINRLRINFIVEKLKSDPNFMNYKISYLAEVSGFSSHSSFATVFKSITGITPITFIDLLKNEREAMAPKNDSYEKE